MRRSAFLVIAAVLCLPAVSTQARQSADCFTDLVVVSPSLNQYLPRGSEAALQNMRGNTISFSVQWTGGNYYTDKHKIVAYLVGVTRKPGLNINTGDTLDPDFVFDEALNPAWEFPGDEAPTYDSLNRLTIVTKGEILAYTPVPIVVSSYDFGGTATIYAQAVECAPSQSYTFPVDFDTDGLPDAWETGKFFWTQDGGRIAYNPGLTVTPGIMAAQDGASDQDKDDRAAAVHTQLGDGLTAAEEYRGVTIQGVPGRLEEHSTFGPANGGPSGDKGGPDVKDIFVYDGKYTIGKGPKKTSGDLFLGGNSYLSDFKCIWHKILLNEMTSNKGLAGDVNKNGEFTKQKAIWLANDSITFDGRDLLGFSSNSVKDASTVKIDAADISALATAAGTPNFQTLLNWHVAHELGHKLSLIHPTTTRTFANPVPAADATSYFSVGVKDLRFWMPRTEAGTAKHDLEFVMNYAGKKATVGQNGRIDTTDTIAIHGAQHKCQVNQASTMVNIAAGNVLNLEGHIGRLLDPVVELENPQSLLKAETDQKNIKIKN